MLTKLVEMCSLLFYLLEDFVLNGCYFFEKLFGRFLPGKTSEMGILFLQWNHGDSGHLSLLG